MNYNSKTLSRALGWEHFIIGLSLLTLRNTIINEILKVEKWYLEDKNSGRTTNTIS